MDKIATIKGALAALDQTHPDDMGELELTEQVEIGAALWDIIATANKLIDPIKSRLREEAVNALHGNEGAHEFSGTNGGKATVQIPKPSTKVCKDADMQSVRACLGDYQFEQAFTATTSYKVNTDNVEAMIEKLEDDPKVEALTGAIEIKENTPRVNFRR